MLELHPIIMEDLEQICAAGISWDKLYGSTVLVTGAGGMIASYLCYALLHLNDQRNAGITIIALVRNEQKARRHFGAIVQRSDFRLLVQDVCAPVDTPDPIDYIIHAASQASPRQFTADPVGTITANTVGTQRMLDLAVQKQSKAVLYLSTREIYGQPVDDREFVDEEDYGVLNPVLVRSCYPESKRMAETLCMAYRHQYGLNSKVARIAHSYGPGMTIGDGRVMGDFIQCVLRGENIRMNSDGSTVLGVTYLSDLVVGLLMTLLQFEQAVYNISDDTAIITVKELAELLASLYPEKRLAVECVTVADGVKAGYLAHRVGLLRSGKARQEGWAPHTTVREGFRRTVEAAKQLSEEVYA